MNTTSSLPDVSNRKKMCLFRLITWFMSFLMVCYAELYYQYCMSVYFFFEQWMARKFANQDGSKLLSQEFHSTPGDSSNFRADGENILFQFVHLQIAWPLKFSSTLNIFRSKRQIFLYFITYLVSIRVEFELDGSKNSQSIFVDPWHELHIVHKRIRK
jgi:hypothetical protein